MGEKQCYSTIFLWHNLLLLLKALEGCRCRLGNEQWHFSCFYFWDCQRKSKGKIVKSRLSLDLAFYNALSISLAHRILCPNIHAMLYLVMIAPVKISQVHTLCCTWLWHALTYLQITCGMFRKFVLYLSNSNLSWVDLHRI